MSTTSGRRSRRVSSVGTSENHQILCAISEARGLSPSVGLAFINLSTCEAILSQINDTQFYIKTIQKIRVSEPSRILITSASCPPNPKSTLLELLQKDLPDVSIEPLPREYWSEAAGLDFVQGLAYEEDVGAIKFALRGKFYAVCAFSAVSY